MNLESQRNRLHELRRTIGNPNMPVEYANDVVNTVFNPMTRHQLLEGTRQRPDFFRELLFKNREAYKKDHGRVPSNPELCANFIIYRICQGAWNEAEEDFAKREREVLGVISRLDYAHGVFITVSSVLVAEDALRQQGDESSMKTVNYVEEIVGVELPPEVSADIYIASIRNKQNALNSLKKDPSGFLLIDEYVEEIKSHAINIRNGTNPKGLMRRIHLYQVPEFVVAGAELGRDLYKLIYLLAEKLSPV